MSSDLLPQPHPPGRSRTASAWSALIALLFFLLLIVFHPHVLRGSVRTLLWLSQPFTGLTIHAEKIQVSFGKPLFFKKVTITSGSAPHQSHLNLETLTIKFASIWKICFKHYPLFHYLQATGGTGLIDFRNEKSIASSSTQTLFSLQNLIHPNLIKLPSSLSLYDISLVLITENQRYTLDHLSSFLPQKEKGHLAYEAITIEAGSISCHLTKSRCDAFWDGTTLHLKNLPLTEEVLLHSLELTPHHNRLDIGIISTAFHGILRADGSFRQKMGPYFDGAVLGQQLPLERISKFLGLSKKISGVLREGRLIFRGSPGHITNSEASLRVLVDHFRWNKKDWASLAMTSHLIGRKVSITDFQLKQQDNRIFAAGEMSLPEEWRQIAQAPFHLKLKATITDVSQLGDLFSSSWEDVNGKFFMDGEIRGATNRAEGYLNMQGTEITLRGLPLNALKGEFVFEGDKTNIANVELWNGNNLLQFSGIIGNSWPHQYEGKGTIHGSKFFEQFKQFLFPDCALLKELCSGLLEGRWNGKGDALSHEGNFDFSIRHIAHVPPEMNLHCIGSYNPEKIECSTLNLTAGDKKITTELSLTSQAICLRNIVSLHDEKKTLTGNILLPLNGLALLRGSSLLAAWNFSTAMDIAVHLDHLPLQDMRSFFKAPIISGLLSGDIHASGRLSDPSLSIVLQGYDLPSPNSPQSLAQLELKASATKGFGTIEGFLREEKNEIFSLKGSLPLGFTRFEESAPLKPREELLLAPAQAPLHLTATFPQISLDALAPHFLPSSIKLVKGIASGKITVEGTAIQPQPSGNIQVNAKKVELSPFLSPLQNLQATWTLAKDKITLTHFFSMMGEGILKGSGTSTGHWGQFHHDYHFSGNNLLLAENTNLKIQGNTELMLQGNQEKGVLEGKVTAQEFSWKPQLVITPFLIPPGVLFSQPKKNISQTSPSWITELSVNIPSQKEELHLRGALTSPALDGKMTLKDFSLKTPAGPLAILEANATFQPNQPWVPNIHLLARGVFGNYNMLIHIPETAPQPQLFVESQPQLSQETAVLLLASPKMSSSDSWLSELPYWVRQQELGNNYWMPFYFSTMAKEDTGLGFTNSGVGCVVEVK